MRIFTLLRTIASRILLILIIMIFTPFLVLFMILPDRIKYANRFLYKVIHGIYWLIFKCSFLPIRFIGRHHIPDEPVIFASNHQSSLDIPLVGSLAGGTPHLWLARTELLESFLFRLLVPHLAIMVNVNEPKKAVSSLRKILRLSRQTHAHIVIFPEGERHADGEIHEFFAGFAILAKQSNRAVVPVRLFGANKVYPVDSFLVHWHPITVVVGKPMRCASDESEKEFTQRVRQWFLEQKEE